MCAEMLWRELFRSADLCEAKAFATTLEAIEFPTRLHLADGRPLEHAEDELADSGDDARFLPGPFIVQVPADDWPVLVGVAEEIIDEQRVFDADLHARRRIHAQLNLAVLMAAIGVTVAIVLLIRDR